MNKRFSAPLRDALIITLITLCIYLLTASGHLYSPDEETMFLVANSIATRGAVDLPNDQSLPLIALHQGRSGLWYSHFGILPSLLALPTVVIGRLVGGDSPAGTLVGHLLTSLINAPITALTAGLLALFVRRLGYGRAAAWIVALVFAFATTAWVYARTFFSEPLTALLLLVAVERAHAFCLGGQRAHALQSGLACGLILATRIAGAVALPWVFVYLFVGRLGIGDRGAEEQESGGAGESQAASIKRQASHSAFGLQPSAFFWLLGLVPGLVLFAAYNLARGEPLWSTGYGSESWVFTTPLSVSIPGMFWQPERGLLFYAPPILLSLFGLWAFARRHGMLALLIFLISVSYTLLHAGRTAWEGGAAWGPRYILALLPLWMLSAAPFVVPQRSKTIRPSSFVFRLSSFVSILCATLGFIVTLLGILINFNTYFNDQPLRERGMLFGAQTPIAAHWLLLNERLAEATDRSDRCVLGNGFYPPEGQAGEQLPRRIGSQGSLACMTSAPTEIGLLLDDRRPPNAPVGELTLLVNGAPIAGTQPGHQRRYSIVASPGRTTLELRSTTWNPRTAGFSERDDELGVALMTLEAKPVGAAPLPIVDATIEPLPTDAIKRWAWYYQPTNHHLVDMWWWYLPRSEIGPTGTTIFGVLLVLVALAALGGALLIGRRTVTDAQASRQTVSHSIKAEQP